MPLSPTHSYSLCYRSSFSLLMVAEHNCLQASSSQHHETLTYKYLKISCSPPNMLLNSILGLRIQAPSIAIQCTLLENCGSSLIPEFSSLLAPGRKSNVAQIKGHRLKNLTGLDFGSAIYQLCDLKNIQFSRSVVSDSFQPHELQHIRPPCPSPTPRVHSNLCLSSRWCHPAISSCYPVLVLSSIFPSIWVFSNKSVICIRWPKYWSLSFSISPSDEHSRLISFSIYRFNLLAVQGTLESLLQHRSSKASILWHSAFFIVQLSHHTWLD